MAFQTPITIAEALQQIDRDNYLLPAIQREVVWNADQISRLFDSLMQDYPIGSFLFWRVEPEQSKDYVFYEFMQDYHQKNNRHLKKHNMLNPRQVTGVLDGQQRLTALNIGIRGSHAVKIPYRWAAYDANFPGRFLYLRLDDTADLNEMGMKYDFRFLTENQAAAGNERGQHWFKVSEIWNMDPFKDIFRYIQNHDLASDGQEFAHDTLQRLHFLVHKEPVISYYEEKEQDLDKVLNIFIRVNSGGTVLSYSDLLLSIATAQWKNVDAREVIYGLVDELNSIGLGFNFSKDLILKSGLMLTDIPSVAFRVTNFNAKNMATLEDAWHDIAQALRMAVRLFNTFGFSEKTLTASSSIIPVAYYLHQIGATDSYLTHHSSYEDREKIRGWLVRSLLKPGIWGSGLDSLLLALRNTLKEHANDGFPVQKLESSMSQLGKSLRFEEEEIDSLSSMSINDRRTFSFLSLLYPGMDYRNEFHIDHVFPANDFSRSKLVKAGVHEDQIDDHLSAYNLIPNLQLMEGPINQSKQDKTPSEWIQQYFPDEGARAAYLSRHLLGDIPTDVTGFLDFFEARRDRIESRVRQILGVGSPRSADEPVPEETPDLT